MADRNETDRAGVRPAVDQEVVQPAELGWPADDEAGGGGREGPVVRFKRRRWAAVRGDKNAADAGLAEGTGPRQARTFRLLTSAPADAAAAAPDPTAGPARAAVVSAGTRTKRRRRDPSQQPGAVNRIVFETAPPVAATAPDAPAAADPLGIDLSSSARFDEVMQAIDGVRRLLDDARRARRFRIV